MDASAWLSVNHVDLVANGLPEDVGGGDLPDSIEKTFTMKIIDEKGETKDVECPVDLLVAKVSESSAETARISSGTRFALSQWLEKCAKNKSKSQNCKL